MWFRWESRHLRCIWDPGWGTHRGQWKVSLALQQLLKSRKTHAGRVGSSSANVYGEGTFHGDVHSNSVAGFRRERSFKVAAGARLPRARVRYVNPPGVLHDREDRGYGIRTCRLVDVCDCKSETDPITTSISRAILI